MTRRLAILIALGAVAMTAGCPSTAPTGVGESTLSGTPRPSGTKKPPAVRPSATPTGTAGGGNGTPTPGPQATKTPTATGSGTPGPTGSGTPAPTGSGTPSATPSGTAATPTPEPAPKFATVLIEPTGFKPSNVRVQKGGSVTFTNRDTGAEHSVAPDGDSQFTGTGNLEKRVAPAMDGGSAGLSFVEIGEYPFKCGVHPTETGKIIVVAEQK